MKKTSPFAAPSTTKKAKLRSLAAWLYDFMKFRWCVFKY